MHLACKSVCLWVRRLLSDAPQTPQAELGFTLLCSFIEEKVRE